MAIPGATLVPTMKRQEYDLLNAFLTEQFGLHFPEHKREILESRLRGRVAELRLSSFMDYYFMLQYEGDGELSRVASLVTNNETYFFRETFQMDALFEHGIDAVLADAGIKGGVRLLCAACSSGEEAYTLSIVAKNNQFRMWGVPLTVDAFDVDEQRIALATRAEYGASSLRALETDQAERMFRPGRNAGLMVLKDLYRAGVSFKVANILRFESWGRANYYDVVFCRNVLIYFEEGRLRDAISHFARCLRPGGLLFLGHSESIIGMTSEFEPVRLGNCIAYVRT